jgi:hypothetical protein
MGCNLDAAGVESVLGRHLFRLAADLVTLQANRALLRRHFLGHRHPRHGLDRHPRRRQRPALLRQVAEEGLELSHFV